MAETEEQRLRRIFVEYHEKRLHRNIKKIQEGKNDEITKTRQFALIRENIDKADSELRGCLNTLAEEGRVKSDCYSDYGRKVNKTVDILENLRSYGKSKSFYLPCISEMLDDESLSMIKEINEKIKERTTYGRRNELAEENSIVLTWSNASKAWYPTGKAKRKETVNLDSNMILVKDSKDKSKLGHVTSCLSNYPLYGASFEAIYERKETPFVVGIMTWIERQLQKEEAEEERKKHE
jgi:hypothetical protein